MGRPTLCTWQPTPRPARDSERLFHLATGRTTTAGSRALPAGGHVSGRSSTRERLTAGRPASWGPGRRAGALRGPRSGSPVPSLGGQQTQPSTPGASLCPVPAGQVHLGGRSPARLGSSHGGEQGYESLTGPSPTRGSTRNMPTFQRGKPRPRVVGFLAQGPPASRRPVADVGTGGPCLVAVGV